MLYCKEPLISAELSCFTLLFLVYCLFTSELWVFGGGVVSILPTYYVCGPHPYLKEAGIRVTHPAIAIPYQAAAAPQLLPVAVNWAPAVFG